MVKLRHLLPTLTLFSILFATCALAQNSLTSIQDTVTNADGTPFNGTVIVTWNGFTAPSGGTIAPHSTSAQIYNGVLSILLVPTTTASAGAYYLATYNSSDGTTTWAETWQVPPSTTPLTLNQVRVPQAGGGSTGSSGGSGITLPIPISDVTNLTSTLAGMSASISTLTTQLSSLTVTPVFVDGETPSGAANGSNRSFSLANTPSPATSLDLYRNGLVQTAGVDFTIAGSTITFLQVATPQTGDLLQAYYRAAGVGPAAAFKDDESPAGALNGVNTTFTLSFAPNPVLSLRLYKNGLLLKPGADYLLSGATITFASTPQATDVIVSYYRH
jgi:hypothetical protein